MRHVRRVPLMVDDGQFVVSHAVPDALHFISIAVVPSSSHLISPAGQFSVTGLAHSAVPVASEQT